jgi:hypothetical protein
VRLGGQSMRDADPTATVIDPSAVPSPIDLGTVTINGQDAGPGILIQGNPATTPAAPSGPMATFKKFLPWLLGAGALAGAWWYFGRDGREGGADDDRPLADG